jgi:hypothetical protein
MVPVAVAVVAAATAAVRADVELRLKRKGSSGRDTFPGRLAFVHWSDCHGGRLPSPLNDAQCTPQ